jgi:hypothetical protein
MREITAKFSRIVNSERVAALPGRMPDLHLSRDEIDDVAAYILSLRQ